MEIPVPSHTSPREASHAEQFRESLPSTDASGVKLIGPIKMSICIPNALCRVIAGCLLLTLACGVLRAESGSKLSGRV